MSRNVIIKHKNNPTSINYNSFVKDLPTSLSEEEKRKLAQGILVISNRKGKEGLCIVNTEGEVKWVAMSCDGELPPNVEAAIAEAISSLSNEMIAYVDETVEENISESLEEYDAVVVESGTNLYNTIIDYVDSGLTETSERIDAEKEALLGEIEELKNTISALTEYIHNLKFSDHVLIQENAYMALLEAGHVVIDENGIMEGDDDFDEDTAYEVVYNKDVYYCIPEDGYVPPTPTPTGSTVDVSGSTFVANEVEEGEHEGEYTLVLDDTVTVSGSTIVIEEGGSQPEDEGDADVGEDNDITLDDDTEVPEGSTTLELSNSFDIDTENNTLIIL